ncbi:hypothetical protein L249_2198 [Ophiocordyceps polyrhachis-furcata BCC 54312]|uniref:Nucleoside transporter n=1 Tax=Ophiocordyceps polyrhachis-furcata BCC 54312 TaxID=1330021 RepID=A0A367LNF2_9HYPO|nr:hypothetical protein L249_2198 [Ophiocordyceps polyrhachis-furcata BCC 54312]
MDRSRAAYERLGDDDDVDDDGVLARSALVDGPPFSWLEYIIFGFLGVAMLWAWNMFLAAAPYFSSRFAADPWIEANFQSAILAASTLVNLGTLVVLTNLQREASYTFRINLALVINTVVFVLLTCSTAVALDASPAAYLVFLLIVVAAASWATGLSQNGCFAFAASFGRPEYTQALMAGQSIAGVLPAVAQVATVLLFPPKHHANNADHVPSKAQTSAFVYFLTAVAISVSALVALAALARRHRGGIVIGSSMAASVASIQEAERAARKVASLWHLFAKLRWLAVGVALTFAATMFFPVFTTKTLSVHPDAAPIFRPAAFIPLAFVCWNLGDLGGRVLAVLPFSLKHRPFALFLLAVVRLAQLPLYLLCNIGGRGAVVSSDFFYLVVVQLLFGLSNGWLGSSFMMAAGEWVDAGEREAAGGFMGLCLVLGLTLGSLLSFTVSDI